LHSTRHRAEDEAYPAQAHQAALLVGSSASIGLSHTPDQPHADPKIAHQSSNKSKNDETIGIKNEEKTTEKLTKEVFGKTISPGKFEENAQNTPLSTHNSNPVTSPRRRHIPPHRHNTEKPAGVFPNRLSR
jgi:hypothetical protein